MPLNLSNSGPSGIAVINRWANKHENDVNQHTAQINQLHSLVARLFELNPSLVKPGASPK